MHPDKAIRIAASEIPRIIPCGSLAVAYTYRENPPPGNTKDTSELPQTRQARARSSVFRAELLLQPFQHAEAGVELGDLNELVRLVCLRD